MYSSPEVENKLANDCCIPIGYVTDKGEFTEQYPYNPNGSTGN